MLAAQMKRNIKQKGQALLVILLVMAVILTIALSIASRSVTDISVSKQEDDASRAFSAAEAGVEQALNSGTLQTSANLSSGGTFNATVQDLVSSGTKEYVVPLLVASGESVPIWFANHDTNNGNALACSANYPCSVANDLTLCWGSGTYSSDSLKPAVEISVFYTTSGNNWATTKIARAVYDPYNSRSGSNNFSTPVGGGQTIDSTVFSFCQNFKLSDLGVTARPNITDATGPQFMRVKLFYNTDRSYPVGIIVNDANASLPPQGNDINSLGQSGDAARKIEVNRLFRDLPPVFDFGVYSGSGGLTQ